jgi:hypothetical protein
MEPYALNRLLYEGGLVLDPEQQQQPPSELTEEHGGVLIPLKTTLELRDDHVEGQAFITRAPLKAANSVVKYGQTPFPSLDA